MSNDNTPAQPRSRAGQAAAAAARRERGRLMAQDALGASQNLSAAVLTSRMIEAAVSAATAAEAARAAAIVAGIEASQTRIEARRFLRRTAIIIATIAFLSGLAAGHFLAL